METSLKMEDTLQRRVQHLASQRHRSPQWLMLEAIEQYIDREEARESFKQEALASWAVYQQTNRLTQSPVCLKWNSVNLYQRNHTMQWTQTQSIAYECAREAITHLMAIYTGQIYEEKKKAKPDLERIAELSNLRTKLIDVRRSIRATDDAQVAQIRAEYGALVRAWTTERHALAA